MGTFLAALISGIALAVLLNGRGETWPVAAAALGVLAGTLAGRLRGEGEPPPGRPWQHPWLAAGLGMALGVVSAWGVERGPPPLPASLLEGEVQLEGRVVDREERIGSSRLLVEGVRVPERGWETGERVRITLRGPPLTALPGDRVRLSARLRTLEPADVPGGFDFAAHLWHQGVVATGFSRQPVEVVEKDRAPSWNRWRHQLVQWLGERIPPDQQGLTAALLVGRRGFLDRPLSGALQSAGIFHLVAISGLHLGLVAGWSFLLIRLLLTAVLPLARRHDLKRPAALLTLVPVWTYTAMAGWGIPTQRAAVMVTLFLVAIGVGRHSQGWRALGLAAVVLLLAHPMELFHAGFQLSFAAVAVILWLLPRLPTGDWRARLLAGAAITLVVSVALSPLQAHHFHRLSPYGLPANLLAVPWVSLVSVPLGLLVLLLWPVWETGADWAARAMGWSLEPIRLLALWLDGLPGAWLRLPGPPLAGLCGFVALGIGALAGRHRGWRLTSLVLALAALAWPHPAPPADRLLMAVLPVGQAQSVVLHIPGDGWSVVDAGGYHSPYYDVGEDLISPFLWYHGATALTRLVVSHPQRDHMAGAGALVRNFPLHSLWVGRFPDQERERSAYAQLLARARAGGSRVERVAAGTTAPAGEGRWRVVWPPPEEGDGDLNARSLVLELEFGHHRLLFPADATQAAEQAMLAAGEPGPVDLLLAPHHGSGGSSSPPFVAATRPRHVVFSVDEGRRLPKPAIEERWDREGATLWRTDRQGMITVESDGETLTVKGNTP